MADSNVINQAFDLSGYKSSLLDEKKSLSLDALKKDESRCKACEAVLRMKGEDTAHMSKAEISSKGVDAMRWAQNNIAMGVKNFYDMMATADNTQKTALLYMMKAYEKSDSTWGGRFAAVYQGAADPTVIAGIASGIFSFGAGAVAAQAGRMAAMQALKIGLEKAATEIVASRVGTIVAEKVVQNAVIHGVGERLGAHLAKKTALAAFERAAIPGAANAALTNAIEQGVKIQRLSVNGSTFQQEAHFSWGKFAVGTATGAVTSGLMGAGGFRLGKWNAGDVAGAPTKLGAFASSAYGASKTAINYGTEKIGNFATTSSNFVRQGVNAAGSLVARAWFAMPGPEALTSTSFMGGAVVGALGTGLNEARKGLSTFAAQNINMGAAIRFIQKHHVLLQELNLGQVAAAALDIGESCTAIAKSIGSTSTQIGKFQDKLSSAQTAASELVTRIGKITATTSEKERAKLAKDIDKFTEKFLKQAEPLTVRLQEIVEHIETADNGAALYARNLNNAIGDGILSNAGRLRYADRAAQLQANLSTHTGFINGITHEIPRLQGAARDIERISSFANNARMQFDQNNHTAAALSLTDLVNVISSGRAKTTMEDITKTLLPDLGKAVAKTIIPVKKKTEQIFSKIGQDIVDPQLSYFFRLKNNAGVRIHKMTWLGIWPEHNFDDYKRFNRMLPAKFVDAAQWVMRDIEGAKPRSARGASAGEMTDIKQRWAKYIADAIDTLTDTTTGGAKDYSRLTPAQRKVADDLIIEYTRWTVMRYGLWREGGFPSTFGPEMIDALKHASPELQSKLKLVIANQNRDGFPNPIRRLVAPYASYQFYRRHAYDARNDFFNENSGQWLMNRVKETWPYITGKRVDKAETYKAMMENTLKNTQWTYKTAWSGYDKMSIVRAPFRVLVALPWNITQKVGWKAVGGTTGLATMAVGLGLGSHLIEESVEHFTGETDLDAGSRIWQGELAAFDYVGGGAGRWSMKVPLKIAGWATGLNTQAPQNVIDQYAHIRPEWLGLRIGGYTPFSDRYDVATAGKIFGMPGIGGIGSLAPASTTDPDTKKSKTPASTPSTPKGVDAAETRPPVNGKTSSYALAGDFGQAAHKPAPAHHTPPVITAAAHPAEKALTKVEKVLEFRQNIESSQSVAVADARTPALEARKLDPAAPQEKPV